MQFNNALICAPDLEEAIDRQPLIVAPDMPLVCAIALMSQVRGSSCLLDSLNSKSDSSPVNEARSSCVLVMQGSQLLGIFTERNIVRLIVSGINFEQTTVVEVMSHPVITLKLADFQEIFAALFLFRRYQIRHLVIVDEHGQLVGVVSPESIRQVLRPANLLKLRRVSEVMTKQVIHAPMTASVLRLARLMAQHQVSCVVITEENAEGGLYPVGIVTERDLVQFQALQLGLFKTQAQTVMSTPLFLLSPEDFLWHAYQEMQRRHVGRLVVSWNWGRGLGIVTQTSLLRVFDPIEMYGVIETLQRTIKQLEAEKAELLQTHNVELDQQVRSHPAKSQKKVD